MDGNVTNGDSNKSIEQRKSGKVEAPVKMEDNTKLQRIVSAGIGEFNIAASFWSATHQNEKSYSDEEKKSKVSSFLNFDNGRVILSEVFKIPLFSNPAIVKLFNKIKRKSDNVVEENVNEVKDANEKQTKVKTSAEKQNKGQVKAATIKTTKTATKKTTTRKPTDGHEK